LSHIPNGQLPKATALDIPSAVAFGGVKLNIRWKKQVTGYPRLSGGLVMQI
jgi:hypothetical protein